jgi:hypothetical protein
MSLQMGIVISSQRSLETSPERVAAEARAPSLNNVKTFRNAMAHTLLEICFHKFIRVTFWIEF